MQTVSEPYTRSAGRIASSAAPKQPPHTAQRYRRTPGGCQCKRSEKTHAFTITSKRIHRRMPAVFHCVKLDLFKFYPLFGFLCVCVSNLVSVLGVLLNIHPPLALVESLLSSGTVLSIWILWRFQAVD